MSNKYIPPRPWTVSKLAHLQKGIAAIVDAEGITVTIGDSTVITFLVALENARFHQDKGRNNLFPCLSQAKNIFSAMRPRSKGYAVP